MSEIADLTVADLLGKFSRRELSPVEVVDDTLARIERFNPLVNAFVLVDEAGARAAARESEARWQRGAPAGALDGIPATIKDNIWVKGLPARKGSRTVDDTPAPADAPAVARLRESGAIILGKTALPEYGWIGVCHSPLTGITRNPWKLDRTPGGSSGGAAVAALLNLGWLHLGTDGAGSIRIPAAFTGVFGIKPSYGRVPAYPASPFTVLAHQGPLARTVDDAARMLSAIAGPDWRDISAWNTAAPDFTRNLERGVRGLRIAWSPRLGQVTKIDPEIEAATKQAAQVFEELGASVEEADPDLSSAAEVIRALWESVSATIVDQVPHTERGIMDPGFVRMAQRGRANSLTDYLAAHAARSDLLLTMLKFHERYDLLLTPQMPVPAFEVGREAPAAGEWGKEWIEWSPYTYPFNLTQQPAASVPCGLTSEGLPIGLQIVGRPHADMQVLQASKAFEAPRPFPVLSEPRQ
ncbi:MAG: aspartyl-tRNA(Asn)/glutamyl-tRNA(Gln) amidotransferase subunit [Variibacter sp.]|nr:aspartyl-tRNA(Asn)/glutamyl-tRNA(Gln) amidotransferase subunit [Variibacter sp.]